MGFSRSLILAALVFAPTISFAADDDVHIRPHPLNGGFRAAAVTDTVGVGFLATSADPNKVHVGGVWDFDTPYYADDITGTDSTQFWTFVHAPNASDGTIRFLTTVSRPFWYYDWGNDINAGDHNLWMSRIGQRVFRRTGLAGVWHEDDLSTVPDTGTISPGFAHNLVGSGSAWCGLRLNGDPNAPVDPYTGNAYTSEIQFSDFRGSSPTARSAYPGYASQWDQLMYRDFAYQTDSPGTVSFLYRAELDSVPTGDPGTSPNDGGGWFTPDPFSSVNLVCKANSGGIEPVDSFEVWVGAPRETGIYDSAHRYLSDTIDFGQGGADAPKILFACTGVRTGSASLALPGGASWSTVRVVFRVKTNRFFDDRAPAGTPTPTAWNSTTGAVVIDNVNVNGNVSDFETPGQILPRFTWVAEGGPNAAVTENPPSSSWITTGREPARYGHIHNLGSLPFAPFTNTSQMAGNVAVQSNHDDPNHDFVAESQNWMISPTVCLTGPRAADQGIPPTLRNEAQYTRLAFDFYSGWGDIASTGELYVVAVRWMGPAGGQVEGPKKPAWSLFWVPGVDFGDDADSIAFRFDDESVLQNATPGLAQVDSLQFAIQQQLRCGRYNAPACGQVDGGYIDNVQALFVRNQPFTGVDPGAPVLDFVRGAYPNPSGDGSATVKFTLSRAVPVTLRFYDLRGALVYEAKTGGKPGENQFRWDGTTRLGTSVASGIYFYRLYADGVEFRNNQQRVVFVGRPDR